MVESRREPGRAPASECFHAEALEPAPLSPSIPTANQRDLPKSKGPSRMEEPLMEEGQ